MYDFSKARTVRERLNILKTILLNEFVSSRNLIELEDLDLTGYRLRIKGLKADTINNSNQEAESIYNENQKAVIEINNSKQEARDQIKNSNQKSFLIKNNQQNATWINSTEQKADGVNTNNSVIKKKVIT